MNQSPEHGFGDFFITQNDAFTPRFSAITKISKPYCFYYVNILTNNITVKNIK